MNSFFLTRLLARRLLQSKKSDVLFSMTSWVAVLSMALGVAALFISLSVTTGFQKVYKEAMLRFNSHLVLTKAGEIENPENLEEKFPATFRNEIVGINPFLYREGMVVSGDSLRGVVIKGVPLENFQKLSHMEMIIREPSLIVGSGWLPFVKNDEVRILFPHDNREETVKKFRIGGSFESGLYEYDSSFAFLPLEEAQNDFGVGRRVSGIEIWLKQADRADYWKKELQPVFDFPYVLMSWRDINENLFRALDFEKRVFFILMLVLTMVASLNLLASLIMFLLQIRRQIALLRCLGLTWSRIKKIFLLDALLIGSAGLSLGLLLSVTSLWLIQKWSLIPLAKEIYFVETVPVQFSLINFLLVAGSAIGIVLLGSLLTLGGLRRLPILSALVEK
ncbi:MAG: ABC transporter permease [Deltaproteobacteria bacterium]|nr:ABC transporter permease [Deltaproteobacteria bacterium]